ncbi:MAG: hypothetical protein R3Y63_04115 [Eubacteriales bacterium]
MAYHLKDLKITSTDLVDQGANPDAQIGLFKSLFSGLKSGKGNEMEEKRVYLEEGSSRSFDDVLREEVGKGAFQEEIIGVNPNISGEKEVLKAYESKISKLENALALVEMEQVAKSYEVLGYEPKTLAKKLCVMKASGGYEDYIEALDVGLTLLGKNSLFQEIGHSAVYTAQGVEDLMKGEGCSREAAFMKAYEENPEFAREYDSGYYN